MFKHGDNVIIFDAYGHHKEGTLYLPPITRTGQGRVFREDRIETGSYSVHTLILPGGRKYRTEGRLYPN